MSSQSAGPQSGLVVRLDLGHLMGVFTSLYVLAVKLIIGIAVWRAL